MIAPGSHMANERRKAGRSDVCARVSRNADAVLQHDPGAGAGGERLGFVTPYLDDVQARINANYTEAGYTVVADRHLGIQDNFSFSEISAEEMRVMTREVAAAKPDAIAIVCTNMRGAPLARE